MPGNSVTFTIADPRGDLSGVRLYQEARIPGDRLDFRRRGDRWELVIDRPPVCRMEYLLEVRHGNGNTELITDPANPLRAPGAFGTKSVREFGCYATPAWLAMQAPVGDRRELEFPAPSLGGTIPAMIWSPAGTPDTEPLPLLVVHDGPEYDSLASLLTFLSAGVSAGWLPRLRAALLGPGHRDRWYSANPVYARALRRVVHDELAPRLATTARIGMGTSLGGLAMLHAHCRHPGTFGALFLQSGSFFTAALDSQEKRFGHFARIVAFVAAVHAGHQPGRPVPVTLTCGGIEENVANNRLMAQTLRSHGYPAELHEVADLHNYTAWRDAFHPYLTDLLGRFCR
ncbi:MAG TPA: alpha/beta hydrolase-fold protein [Streptosporangiaceae bacterium]